MSGTRSEAAWSDFWSNGGAGPESGCLPKGLRGIDTVQRAVWSGIARRLRPGAKVLDLATGDGAVLGKLRAARTDLKLLGVDSAARLPPAPRGVTLRAGVAMEALPVGDGSFDLVTSQFGYEYGDRDAIAREVARVLLPRGRYAFIVHNADGPIVAHNLARRSGLGWAVVDSGLLAQAEALVRARRVAPLPTPARFRQAPLEARRLFPGQSVAEEFATAILQTLELGRVRPAAESLEALDELQRRGRNEMARIDALCAAACSAADIAAINAGLQGFGLAPEQTSQLYEPGSEIAFAWCVQGLQPQG